MLGASALLLTVRLGIIIEAYRLTIQQRKMGSQFGTPPAGILRIRNKKGSRGFAK